MEKQGIEPEIPILIRSLAHSMQHTQTLYLSPDGDDSDGSSWVRAYTTFSAVHAAAVNTDTNVFTLIICASATYDLDISGSFDITKQIHVVGKTRGNTIFTNTHASATGIFTVSAAFVILQNIQLSCGTSCFGLLLNSTVSAFRMYDSYINGLSSTAAVNLVECSAAANARFVDIYIIGNPASLLQTCIDLNTTSFGCSFVNCTVAYGAVGINMDNTPNAFSIFNGIEIIACTAGIVIAAACTLNIFRHIHFTLTTTPINDSGTTTDWAHIDSSTSHAHIIPDNLTGTTITAAAGAGNWTAVEVELYSAAAATEPYIITGVEFEPDTGEKYGLRISADGGSTYVWHEIVEATANRSNRILFNPPIEIKQGTQIVGSIRSETGGNNLLVWLKILQY